MFDKAIKSGVNTECLELEDEIAPSNKKLSRKNILKIINKKKSDKNVKVLIRINGIREKVGLKDIITILNNKIQAYWTFVPKINSSEEINILDSLFKEKKLNTKFHATIETNLGLERANDIAVTTYRLESFFWNSRHVS